MNAVEIEEAVGELIQKPYEPDAFIKGFMAAYGASASTIARINNSEGNTSDLPGGCFGESGFTFSPHPQAQSLMSWIPSNQVERRLKGRCGMPYLRTATSLLHRI